MTKIALVGAEADDKEFFAAQLSGHEIAYHDAVLGQPIDPKTEILSVFINTPVTAKLLAELPSLKLVVTRSTGFNHIDVAAAKERGVKVANVPSYGGATVAEYAFTLLLMLTRRMTSVLLESSAAAPSRLRERGMDLNGKTIGVFGTGSIGQGVTKIAKGFGMDVLAYDKLPNQEAASEIGFTYANTPSELLGRADVVTLHMPYSAETHHFLNKALLAQLKQGAIVINTARGELIDTTALVESLKNGSVSAAALDVVESEFLLDPDEIIELATHDDAARATLRHAVSLTALKHMPNVIVTNHNAYNTVDAIAKINQTTADNIRNFIEGKEIHSV